MVLGLHLSHQIGLKLVASALGDLSGRQEADQAKNRPFQESVHPDGVGVQWLNYNPTLPGPPEPYLNLSQCPSTRGQLERLYFKLC